MTGFKTSVDIDALPGRVWAILLDVENWPRWTPTVTSARRLESEALSLGSRTRMKQPKLPPAIWQITELDEARGTFIWVSRSPGVVVTARHVLEATPTGTRAMLSTDFSGILGSLAARLYGNLNRQYVSTEAQCLKAVSETDATLHASASSVRRKEILYK